MISKMLLLATEKHSGQLDKAGMPYILHCMKVMQNLDTEDIELMCIALGHDLLEDTDVTSELLHNLGFSERVIKGIEDVTKSSGMTYEDYVKRIKNNKDAILVKMADLKHNIDVSRLKVVTGNVIKRTVRYIKLYKELENL